MLSSSPPSTLWKYLLLLGSILFLSSCNSPEGKAVDGQRWYAMHNCSACHGNTGSDGTGPGIARTNMSYRTFLSRLRNSQTAIMPAFPQEKLSDQDAADILAFLQTVEKN